jgi:hypothetical protein
MADITTPEITRFANEKGRPTADAAGSMYQTCLRFQQEWTALIAAVGSVPNTPDQIADGSQASAANNADGRKPMTGAQLNNLKALADAMVTWYQTGAPSRIAQLQLVTVNERASF